jgi:hypothetical protein
VHPEEVFQRAVIGPFIFRTKKTRRQFTALPVMMKALAALVPPAARGIRAVAVLLVILHGAFHDN